LTPLGLDDARKIAASFGLRVSAIEPLAGGSVNSNFRLECGRERFFLRVYEEQASAGALAELALVTELARRGVPTPEPLSRRDGAGQLAEHTNKPVALFPWIEGEWLCQVQVTPDHCRRVGEALARVHVAGVEPASEGRFGPPALELRLDHIERHAPEHAASARRIRALLATYVARRDPTLPSGLVHGDLFRDNVLWQGDQIVALIDFESASRGPFAYDLMVCVHAWCFSDRFSSELASAMLRGYQSVRELSRSERASLVTEGAIGALRFAITRITDYAMRAPSGKPPVRDFNRFLARLDALEAGKLKDLVG
jgi:homoserine kinase type II